MKVQAYKAIDKTDNTESFFFLGEDGSYLVLTTNVANSVFKTAEELYESTKRRIIHSGALDWSDYENGYPRRDDMIDPELIEEFEI